MKKYGLIGYPLSHSFSKGYFSGKFMQEKIQDTVYDNFELKDVSQIKELLFYDTELLGLNVTIPYKQSIMPYLDIIDPVATRVGAVNVIKKLGNGILKGYNSDYYGFRISLEGWLGPDLKGLGALVLGTGGAAKAITAVLEDCNIIYLKISRTVGKDCITYFDIRNNTSFVRDYRLIINTTPLGMFPKINEMPNLPYETIDENNLFYDLIYNPEKTLFLQKGESKGAKIINGKEMLILQAERSWQIWNNNE
jgi:shikimate dehydrogenase